MYIESQNFNKRALIKSVIYNQPLLRLNVNYSVESTISL